MFFLLCKFSRFITRFLGPKFLESHLALCIRFKTKTKARSFCRRTLFRRKLEIRYTLQMENSKFQSKHKNSESRIVELSLVSRDGSVVSLYIFRKLFCTIGKDYILVSGCVLHDNKMCINLLCLQ